MNAEVVRLEAALERFYNAPLSGEERAELERSLDSVQRDPNALHHARMFMGPECAPIVRYFGLKIVQFWVERAWHQVPGEFRAQLTQDVMAVCVERSLADLVAAAASPAGAASFAQTTWMKALQVCALVGRASVHENAAAGFFQSLNQLCQEPQSMHVGLGLIKAGSEEFTATTSGSLQHERAVRAKQLVLDQAPGILAMLTTVLTGATAAAAAVEGASAPAFPPEQAQLAHLALDCVTSLFGWLPLSVALGADGLFRAIFAFVRLGGGGSSGQTQRVAHDLALQALQAINEVFSRNLVPKDVQGVVGDVFSELLAFLSHAVAAAQQQAANALDEGFLYEFTHFLRLFVARHFRHVDGAAAAGSPFPVDQFLAVLMQFVFVVPDVDQVTETLGVWSDLLDGLAAQSTHRPDRHGPALCAAQQELVARLHFSRNQAFLARLEDECDTCDPADNDGTGLENDGAEGQSDNELELMLGRAIACFSLIAQLHTMEVIQSIFSVFEADLQQLAALPGTASDTDQRTAVRDCALALRLVASVAEELAASPELVAQTKIAFIDKALSLASYCLSEKLWARGPAFLDLHCQLFGFFEAFAGILGKISQTDVQPVAQLLDCTVPLLMGGGSGTEPRPPPRLSEMAAQVLRALTSVTRAPGLLEMPPLARLVAEVHAVCGQPLLSAAAQQQLYVAVSNGLLLAGPRPSNAEWAGYAARYQATFGPLVDRFCSLSGVSAAADSQTLVELDRAAAVFTRIAAQLSGQPKFARAACVQTLQPALDASLQALQCRAQAPHPALRSMLRFFAAAFDALKAELGGAFLERTVGVVLAAFADEQSLLFGTTVATPRQRSRAMNDLFTHITGCVLDLLAFTVQEPNTGNMVPAIVQFAVARVYPRLAAADDADGCRKLFHLLYSTLLNHWKSFETSSAARELFQAIMRCFVHSLGVRLDVFRYNLDLLNKLNAKLVLFKSQLFLEFRNQLFSVLLDALISGGMDRAHDEITHSLHLMASVDFPSFGQFACDFVGQQTDINPTQAESLVAVVYKSFDVDLPSFTAGIDKLVNDLRFFVRQNLPLT